MRKLCIFDLDGTLIDSVPDLTNSLNHALAAYGLPGRTRAEAQKYVGHGLANFLKSAASGHENADAILDGLREQFTAYYGAHCADETTAYAGVRETLSRLSERGVLLAVNTNKQHEFVEKILDTFFAGIPFAATIGLGDLPRKPDPAGVREILRRTGAVAAQCAYIGDSMVDVQTAKNAGVTSVGVSWGYGGEEELAEAGADRLVYSPAELTELLLTL